MADFPYFQNDMKDFPGLKGLGAQSYENTYDYEKYNQPATLSLLTVPWRADYKDVVRFASEASRDSWLTAQDAQRLVYSTAWLRVPEQAVNVPLPYEAAAHFNYLYVDLPELPVNGSKEPTRLCYFIVDIKYAAPSTTTLTLRLDIWQTYGYRMEISSLELTRGHAPMYRSSVEDFLSNPLENNRYLLAKDVDFSNGTKRAAGIKQYPVGSGTKWLIVALPVAPAYISTIGAGSSTSWSLPTFYNTGARNGYQLGVNGYKWASPSGYEYPSAELPVHTGASSDGSTLDGSYIYGIAYTDAMQALVDFAVKAPHLLAAASYIAVLPSAFVHFASTSYHSIAGHNWRQIAANPNVSLDDYNLTKANIGLPDYAADIAKLYTSPYTYLEISDSEGNSFDVRIEDIAGSKLKFNVDLSLAAASLICNIEAENIGADNNYIVEWKTLYGQTMSKLFGSDVADFALKWGIPTYSVNVKASSIEAARKWRELEVERRAALNAYHQAVRSANTSYQNNTDSNATSVSNTARSNANMVTNTTNSNTAATAKTSYGNLLNSAKSNQQKTVNQQMAREAYYKLIYDATADNTYQTEASQASAFNDAVMGMMNTVGAAASMNFTGALSSSAGTLVTLMNTDRMRQLCRQHNESKTASAERYLYIADPYYGNVPAYTIQNNYLTSSTTSENNTASNITLVDNTLASTTASNNRTTSDTNAVATQATSNANAGYSNADAITAAKENLELAQLKAGAALEAAALQIAPVCKTTGDNTMDALNRRAFKVKAVTQSDYALRATADWFTRYGYAFGAPIDFTNWLEGGSYCHWQGSHAIIKGDVPDMARTFLELALNQGFTVWNDPEKVGDYEND